MMGKARDLGADAVLNVRDSTSGAVVAAVKVAPAPNEADPQA